MEDFAGINFLCSSHITPVFEGPLRINFRGKGQKYAKPRNFPAAKLSDLKVFNFQPLFIHKTFSRESSYDLKYFHLPGSSTTCTGSSWTCILYVLLFWIFLSLTKSLLLSTYGAQHIRCLTPHSSLLNTNICASSR